MFNSKIKIYRAEAELAEKIEQSASVACCSLLETADDKLKKQIFGNVDKLGKTFASAQDSDLYFTKSLLVTTCWNKNDDVFAPEEVWAARHTPSHKRTNLEHNEHEVVGHIVDGWPIDDEGNFIAENTVIEDLPQKFHVVVGSVIYLVWEDENLQKRTDDLITQIEANEKYVSMEALFTSFDYAVQNKDGKSKVISRDENSAWMTKYLRAYGGSGEYEGNKIGRLLRNITFCGKGYVDKPANPESIIFTSAENLPFILDKDEKNENNTNADISGVYILQSDVNSNITKGEDNMADEKEKQIADLQKELAEVRDQLAKADIDKYTSQISDLEDQVKTSTEKIEGLNKQLKESKDKLVAMETELKDLNESKAQVETQLAEAKREKMVTDRISMLVDAGIEKNDAEKKVEVFADLSDEQFQVVAKELIEAKKSMKVEGESSEDQDDDVDDTPADSTDLDKTQAENDVDLTSATEVENEDDEVTKVRNEMATAFAALNPKEKGDK